MNHTGIRQHDTSYDTNRKYEHKKSKKNELHPKIQGFEPTAGTKFERQDKEQQLSLFLVPGTRTVGRRTTVG